ncbi:MAG: hypothetical protein DRP47_11195 [Candidatus Zixiibacteriota bacterium]|nr:MAG: hypothetical protein DRP47_11195 [candidate division Zixibacteria bacterium]
MGTLWWLFVILGVLCIVIEIFTPGFVILWFGIAFLLTAIPVYFEAPLWVIILTYSVSLFVLAVFVRKIALRISSGENSGIKTNADAIIAQQGIVVEEVNTINGTGRVRVNRETWTAISYVDDVIRINDKIEVCSVEGVKLVVKRSI